METEQLKIFDDHRKQIGVATREEVHRKGYWHEAFHCWFVNDDHIYLQLRSDKKKDYPNLFDITAAGHLLFHETVQDGVREIEEEVGIKVPFNELLPLGVIDYCVTKENLIDKELANVFVYKCNLPHDHFTVQEEEVSGIVTARFHDFSELWFGEKEVIHIKGFKIDSSGNRLIIDEYVGKDRFVPHEIGFYQTVIRKIAEIL